MKFFSDLPVDKVIIKALEEIGFLEMTDVQMRAIPTALEGKDIIAQSITGSGKTAAFGVPIVEKIAHGKGLQAAIIGPTRELVNQVSAEMQKFSKHKRLNIVTVFGGVSIEPQMQRLRAADIVVGTPGRMLDHMQRGTLRLNSVKILVLDEADRMLDMGFIDDIRKIISQTPSSRQTMLLSATMPDEIMDIAHRFMKHPVKIMGEREISHHLLKHYYYDILQEEKLSLLEYLIKKEKPHLAIVFCGTRHITDFVARELERAGLEARAIHGGMGQDSRMRVLEGFHRGKPHILVATDVAARGLDIKNVSHIFNYDIPKTAEEYTHRIGRTARFGKTGETMSLLSKQDHEHFRKIIQYIDIEKKHLPDDFSPRKIFFRSERRGFGGPRRFGPRRFGGGRGSGYGDRGGHRGPRRRRFDRR
jgi:ATP-dependent RNA helicase DeaD